MKYQRTAIASLGASAALLVALATHEGYTDRAVVPVQGDRPTVGFGSTFRDDGAPVQMGDTITPVKALQRTLAHIQQDEAGLKRCVTAPLHQHEYDTLVDATYQYGVAAVCRSSMVRLANAGDYASSCRAYAEYRFMTSDVPHPGWQPYRFDVAGQPVRWRFDCSTPGNKVCAGVGKRALARVQSCMGE